MAAGVMVPGPVRSGAIAVRTLRLTMMTSLACYAPVTRRDESIVSPTSFCYGGILLPPAAAEGSSQAAAGRLGTSELITCCLRALCRRAVVFWQLSTSAKSCQLRPCLVWSRSPSTYRTAQRKRVSYLVACRSVPDSLGCARCGNAVQYSYARATGAESVAVEVSSKIVCLDYFVCWLMMCCCAHLRDPWR